MILNRTASSRVGICVMMTSSNETFSALQAICAGNSPVTGEFTGHRWIPRISLICGRINGWVNNRESGDLRRHRAHYDVIVMVYANKKWYLSVRVV